MRRVCREEGQTDSTIDTLRSKVTKVPLTSLQFSYEWFCLQHCLFCQFLSGTLQIHYQTKILSSFGFWLTDQKFIMSDLLQTKVFANRTSRERSATQQLSPFWQQSAFCCKLCFFFVVVCYPIQFSRFFPKFLQVWCSSLGRSWAAADCLCAGVCASIDCHHGDTRLEVARAKDGS